MGRSNENQERISAACGEIVKDLKEKGLKSNSEKAVQHKIPRTGDIILGGEVSIPLGIYKAERDENGKMVNVEFLGKVEKLDKKEVVEER